MRSWGRTAAAVLVALVLVAGGPGGPAAPVAQAAGGGVQTQTATVPVGAEPDGTAVSLEVGVSAPAGTSGRLPAVVLAGGYGATEADTAPAARALAARGYVVLTYSARGLGGSGGAIHLDAPQYEGQDVVALVSWLADRPDVQLDAPGDPRVAVVGESYGGAVALTAAGLDPRIDAVAAGMTWSDLAAAVVPNAAGAPGGTGQPGLYKRAWFSRIVSSASGQLPAGADLSAASGCGRLAEDVCAAYRAAQQPSLDGAAPEQLVDLLQASSPARVLDAVKVPTLLVQGQDDTLFDLDQSATTARQLQAQGVPVSLAWARGGHDGPQGLGRAFTERTVPWLDHYLAGRGAAPPQDFQYELGGTPAGGGTWWAAGAVPAQEPGAGAPRLPMHPTGQDGGDPASPRELLAPYGDQPAALTSLPGVGAVSDLGPTSLRSAGVPVHQSLTWDSEPLADDLAVVGSSAVDLEVSGTASSAALFVALYDVAPDGRVTLPSGGVAPVRVPVPTGGSTAVDVRLPSIVHTVRAGHVLRLVVSSSDAGYAGPGDGRGYRVGLRDGLVVASAPPDATRVSGGGAAALLTSWPVLSLALLLVLVVAGAVVAATVLVRRRARRG